MTMWAVRKRCKKPKKSLAGALCSPCGRRIGKGADDFVDTYGAWSGPDLVEWDN